MQVEHVDEKDLSAVDEPLVVKKPEKDAITFHPALVKLTLDKLDGLTNDQLELINKFVETYKNKVKYSLC